MELLQDNMHSHACCTRLLFFGEKRMEEKEGRNLKGKTGSLRTLYLIPYTSSARTAAGIREKKEQEAAGHSELMHDCISSCFPFTCFILLRCVYPLFLYSSMLYVCGSCASLRRHLSFRLRETRAEFSADSWLLLSSSFSSDQKLSHTHRCPFHFSLSSRALILSLLWHHLSSLVHHPAAMFLITNLRQSSS